MLGGHIAVRAGLDPGLQYLPGVIHIQTKGCFMISGGICNNFGGGNECQYFRGPATEELLLEHPVTSQQE